MTKLGNVPFRDMKQLDEPERIKMISEFLMKNPGKDILVLVDCGDGHADKGDRYVKSIRATVPNVKLIKRNPGPVPGCESIVFRLN